MSRAQVPTLDFFHCLAHNFPLYGPMFAGSSKRLQRGAREGLWSNLGHWLHFGRRRVQMWREHIRQTGDLKQSAPKPCEVWMLVLKLISFSHFFPLLPSIIFLWALFTSYSASGPLKSLSLHPHFVPPYASLCHPFLSMQLFAALLPCFFPPVHPSFTLLLPTSQLKVIWHSSGQVRAWQCFEVWVYHAQSGRMRWEPRASPGLLLVHWEGGWQLWIFRNSFLVKQQCRMKENNVCTAPGHYGQRQAWCPAEFPSAVLTQREMGGASNLSS